mgnify:CR=1 FL=1
MKRIFLLLMCLCTYAITMMGQTVSGVVTSADDGEPLIGVTVKVKGTQAATITDIDGRYQIAAKNGDHLQFSYVGFVENDVVVHGATLDVTMSPDDNGLNEVVVVGYGQAKRITLTGAVSAINGKELQKVPVSSVQNTLACTPSPPGHPAPTHAFMALLRVRPVVPKPGMVMPVTPLRSSPRRSKARTAIISAKVESRPPEMPTTSR